MTTSASAPRIVCLVEVGSHILKHEVPLAYQHELWGLACRRAFEAVELHLKGALRIVGRKVPRTKDHNLGQLLNELCKADDVALPLMQLAYSNQGAAYALIRATRGPRIITRRTTEAGRRRVDQVMVLSKVGGEWAVLMTGNFGGDVEIVKEDMTLTLRSGGKIVSALTDAALGTPDYCLSFPHRGDPNRVRELRRRGARLRDLRDASFYGERAMSRADADAARETAEDIADFVRQVRDYRKALG